MIAFSIDEGLNLKFLCIGIFPKAFHIHALLFHPSLKCRPVRDGFVFQDFVANLPDFDTAFLRTSQFGGVKG